MLFNALTWLVALPCVTNATDVVDSSQAPGMPIAFDPDFFFRFENREGYDRLGVSRGRFSEGSFTVYRARLTLTSAPIELAERLRVRFRFAPQASGSFGSLPSTISTASPGLYEGWIRLESDAVHIDVGRIRLNYGDALVIGDLDWNQVGRSFDGIRGRVDVGDRGWIDVLLTQVSEGINGPGTRALTGDQYFGGLYSSFGGLIDDGFVLEPYALTQIWARSGPDRPNAPASAQGTVGVRVKQVFGRLDLRLEPGIQFGRRRADASTQDVLAYQGNLELGVRIGEGVRLAVEGAYASGDNPDTLTFESYDELFPTTHKWLGLMDVVGIRSNITSGAVHARFKRGRFTGLLDGHLFVRPETVEGQQDYAGTEVNAQAIYGLGRRMSLRGLYGVFLPGRDHFSVEGMFSQQAVHYVEAQTTLRL